MSKQPDWTEGWRQKCERDYLAREPVTKYYSGFSVDWNDACTGIDWATNPFWAPPGPRKAVAGDIYPHPFTPGLWWLMADVRESRLYAEGGGRETMIAYLKLKTAEGDWHAVSDAANDLRVIEARGG